jgi:hypothetical protein
MEAIDMKTKLPACPICCGISPDSGIQVEIETADVAYCSHCKQEAKWDGEFWIIGSDKPRGREGYRGMKVKKLPFHDSVGFYYCGCMGWD